jgi:hypothetical protein
MITKLFRAACALVGVTWIASCSGDATGPDPPYPDMVGGWYYRMVTRSSDGDLCCEFHNLFTWIDSQTAGRFWGNIGGPTLQAKRACMRNGADVALDFPGAWVTGWVTEGGSVSFDFQAVGGPDCQHTGTVNGHSAFGTMTMRHDFGAGIGDVMFSGTWSLEGRPRPGGPWRDCP